MPSRPNSRSRQGASQHRSSTQTDTSGSPPQRDGTASCAVIRTRPRLRSRAGWADAGKPRRSRRNAGKSPHARVRSLSVAASNAFSRIPVTVLTGFLGSGKTTLLNHVLKQQGMDSTAVIVNEFGEIGLDHLLVESAKEDVVLLNSGCLCCTVRGDIVNTLTDLFVKRVKGTVPYFA